jgi:hypothetical protein
LYSAVWVVEAGRLAADTSRDGQQRSCFLYSVGSRAMPHSRKTCLLFFSIPASAKAAKAALPTTAAKEELRCGQGPLCAWCAREISSFRSFFIGKHNVANVKSVRLRGTFVISGLLISIRCINPSAESESRPNLLKRRDRRRTCLCFGAIRPLSCRKANFKEFWSALFEFFN